MDYQVSLDNFRGPLDLLLHLVKQQELDICDIPIARIAEQFLEYVSVIQVVDVERAGDFLVMAATLMEIKSKLLLPPAEEEDETRIDPRAELVRQLVEYKKFKDAAAALEAQAEQQHSRLSRQPALLVPEQDPRDQPLRHVELWDLVSAFGRLMRETLSLQPQQIVADQTPVHVYMDSILHRFRDREEISFSELFTPPYNRGRLVGIFLAILELVRNRQIAAEQPKAFGEISLRLAPQQNDTLEATLERPDA
jgi:segregation and condensation protein A